MVSARLGCVDGRAILVADSLDKYVDIEKFSGGKLPSEPMACIELWSEVCSLATSLASAKATDFVTLDSSKLECPVPRPRQIFAIGINYKAHAAEMNHGLPKEPLVFTKFPSSLNSPFGQINLTGEKCDYEAELVAIIAKPGRISLLAMLGATSLVFVLGKISLIVNCNMPTLLHNSALARAAQASLQSVHG